MKNIQIQVLSPEDVDIQLLVRLLQIYNEVFEHNYPIPQREYLSLLLNNAQYLAIVAKVDNVVIGGLTAHLLPQSFSTKRLMYIYDLGVMPEFQRRGVGSKLLTFVREYCKQHDIDGVFVQADVQDVEAVSFYRASALKDELEAIQFSCNIE
jgi:aminoglycoside 3-N-acetyltransferase I